MKISNIRELCYELYKIDWMRKISADRQMDVLKDFFEESIIAGSLGSNDNDFEDYFYETGFQGECYVCFEEFLGAEYRDEAYIEELLANNDLINIYKKDLIELAINEDIAFEIATASEDETDRPYELMVSFRGGPYLYYSTDKATTKEAYRQLEQDLQNKGINMDNMLPKSAVLRDQNGDDTDIYLFF